ncbi:MAG: NAD+ synthase [Verrucomicrobiota bacterium]|nr:NAD+ synthase [Verrucomicrobiota bacterium]
MKIGFAQFNATVGDLDGNFGRIVAAYDELAQAGADLVLTPELALTGYPPQDLVLKRQFVPDNLRVLEKLQERVSGPGLIVGYVDRHESGGKPFRNAAALLQVGQPMQKTFKSLLPTYDVFDEDRYFAAAQETEPVDFRGRKLGITICEDIWTEDYLPRPLYQRDPVASLVAQGAEIIVNLSASPFIIGKPELRREMICKIAHAHARQIFYCNAIGGNDELVFDGASIAANGRGELIANLPACAEANVVVATDAAPLPQIASSNFPADLENALVLGLRDYLRKCHFKSAVLGLSGGIDSAVVAALAVKALGAANVTGVAMPGPYSSRGSVEDARALAENLGIQFLQIPIGDAFAVFKAQFQEVFAGRAEDATEENMQARLRGMILMSLSNKFGHLLLSTGNKSELAVGYCTIYGDMAGGLAVISDVPKTMVYQLARYMNRERDVIPEPTITKPPSAELRPNQTDQDTLPPYDILDVILRLYVEENRSARDIVAQGFDEKTVAWVRRRVDLNEYKRAQAAPGLKVTSRAFGAGRRMPIAQGYVG